MLLEYVKHPKRGRIGVMVAEHFPFDDHVTIGWSLCCKKDKWDSKKGKAIAIRRAMSHRNTLPKLKPDDSLLAVLSQLKHSGIPHSMFANVVMFIVRAKKYYKHQAIISLKDITYSSLTGA